MRGLHNVIWTLFQSISSYEIHDRVIISYDNLHPCKVAEYIEVYGGILDNLNTEGSCTTTSFERLCLNRLISSLLTWTLKNKYGMALY